MAQQRKREREKERNRETEKERRRERETETECANAQRGPSYPRARENISFPSTHILQLSLRWDGERVRVELSMGENARAPVAISSRGGWVNTSRHVAVICSAEALSHVHVFTFFEAPGFAGWKSDAGDTQL